MTGSSFYNMNNPVRIQQFTCRRNYIQNIKEMNNRRTSFMRAKGCGHQRCSHHNRTVQLVLATVQTANHHTKITIQKILQDQIRCYCRRHPARAGIAAPRHNYLLVILLQLNWTTQVCITQKSTVCKAKISTPPPVS